MSFEDFIDSLPTEIEGKRAQKAEERFPCGQCGGTGKWSGGTNRHGNSYCLACGGRELTNHASFEPGIGLICADRWGF